LVLVKQQTTREPRTGKDRRRKPTSPWSFYSLFYGRRKVVRRVEDRHIHRYVDLYSGRAAFAVMAAILLSLTDGYFTLQLVGRGAEEINPFMDFFLQRGALPFLVVKYLITGLSILFLLVHKNHTVFGGRLLIRNALVAIPLIYALVILYEIYLLQRLNLLSLAR
jgi:hypothetical protein